MAKFNRVTQSITDDNGCCVIKCKGIDRMEKVCKRRDELIKTGYWVIIGYAHVDGVYSCTMQTRVKYNASLTPKDLVDQHA